MDVELLKSSKSTFVSSCRNSAFGLFSYPMGVLPELRQGSDADSVMLITRDAPYSM